MTGPIPANPLADPAEKLSNQIGAIGQSLQNLGIDSSISNSWPAEEAYSTDL